MLDLLWSLSKECACFRIGVSSASFVISNSTRARLTDAKTVDRRGGNRERSSEKVDSWIHGSRNRAALQRRRTCSVCAASTLLVQSLQSFEQNIFLREMLLFALQRQFTVPGGEWKDDAGGNVGDSTRTKSWVRSRTRLTSHGTACPRPWNNLRLSGTADRP